MNLKVLDRSSKVWQVYCWGSFSNSDETEEDFEEDDDIYYYQVHFICNFKIITCENNSSNITQ